MIVDRTARSAAPYTFAVTRYAVGDRSRTRHEFAYAPFALTRVERDAFVDREVAGLVERSRGTFDVSHLRRAYRDALYAPATLPPVEDVTVDRDGRIWLARRPRFADVGRVWLVLGPDDTALWEVRLPSDVRVWDATGREVWGSGGGGAEPPYIVRYRIEVDARVR